MIWKRAATWDGLFRLMRLQDGLVLEALRVKAAHDLVGLNKAAAEQSLVVTRATVSVSRAAS